MAPTGSAGSPGGEEAGAGGTGGTGGDGATGVNPVATARPAAQAHREAKALAPQDQQGPQADPNWAIWLADGASITSRPKRTIQGRRND